MRGSSEAWRTLLRTLRTRIFLSLSDEASAEIASKLSGQVRKFKATYAINEASRQSGINFLGIVRNAPLSAQNRTDLPDTLDRPLLDLR